MMTIEEYEAIGRLKFSFETAFTACICVAAQPIGQKIIETTFGLVPLAALGSKLGDKYGGDHLFAMPAMFYEPEFAHEKERALPDLAAFLAAGLLGSVYEVLKPHNDFASPVWNFFRNIRNACFHGNRFHFQGNNPGDNAIWRGLQLTRDLHGTPLFPNYLGCGDIFILLADIMELIGLPDGQLAVFAPIDPTWTY